MRMTFLYDENRFIFSDKLRMGSLMGCLEGFEGLKIWNPIIYPIFRFQINPKKQKINFSTQILRDYTSSNASM